MNSNQIIQRAIVVVVLSLSGLLLKGQGLSDTLIKLPEVTITDSVFNRMTPRTVIPGEIFQKTNVADIGDILRNEPNISGIRRGGYAVDPVVRGFRYSQLNIFLDEGIHIEGGCPNRMDPVLSHIEPEQIERMEIMRGPYLLQYGPSPSSSIKIVTRDENAFVVRSPKVVSVTGYDNNRKGIRQHLSISGSDGTLYYRLGGGIKNFGNYTDGNGKEWESAFNKKDFYADLGYQINKGEAIIVSYKGTFGREVMYPALPMDEIEDNTHIFSALYTKHDLLIPDNNIQVSVYRSGVYHEMDNRFRPQYSQVVPPYTGKMQAVAKVNTSISGARVIINRKTGNFLINGGFDSELARKDGVREMKMIMQMNGQEFTSIKYFNLWKDAFILNNGLFTGISSGNRKFSYAASMRVDYNYSDSGDTLVIAKDDITWFEVKPAGKVLLSLSASGSWDINKKAKLSLGLARGTRAPDMQERYIKFLATGYDKYDYLGNPDLKPEINYQADLMFNYSLKNSRIFVNLFRSDVQDFITGTLVPPSVARPVSMGAPGVKQFNNIDRAVFYGIEAGVTSTPVENMGVAFSAGYTYAFFPEIEKIILENNQAAGTVILKNDPIPEIPPFEAKLKATYLLVGDRLKPGIEIRAVAKQDAVSGASYEENSPGYVIANLSVDLIPYSWLTITSGINNLFNKAYYDHLNRKLSGSSGKLYEPGRTFFVNLLIRI
ncbi:MAG: TonB-dependent receptor [Bacteroidales bacterium]|nr:TonB-dependent receptor [Bacteroidales bacterium]